MRVKLDTRTCQAYANCLMTAPEVFDLDEAAGTAVILQENPTEAHRPAVAEAVRNCPVQALSLED